MLDPTRRRRWWLYSNVLCLAFLLPTLVVAAQTPPSGELALSVADQVSPGALKCTGGYAYYFSRNSNTLTRLELSIGTRLRINLTDKIPDRLASPFDFAVLPDGHMVFCGIMAKSDGARRTVAPYLLSYDAHGAFSSLSTLQFRFEPRRVAADTAGNLFILGIDSVLGPSVRTTQDLKPSPETTLVFKVSLDGELLAKEYSMSIPASAQQRRDLVGLLRKTLFAVDSMGSKYFQVRENSLLRITASGAAADVVLPVDVENIQMLWNIAPTREGIHILTYEGRNQSIVGRDRGSVELSSPLERRLVFYPLENRLSSLRAGQSLPRVIGELPDGRLVRAIRSRHKISFTVGQ